MINAFLKMENLAEITNWSRGQPDGTYNVFERAIAVSCSDNGFYTHLTSDLLRSVCVRIG